MKIKSAVFVSSSPGLKHCPETGFPEFAFIGRSNVGKSSLINMLTGKKNLAKTSGTPGKTKLINHFLINDQWYIVDLPGYGFAKLSKEIRADIDKRIRNYLSERIQLRHVFLLIDSRLEPQKNDLGFIAWLNKIKLPFTILFTKADKPGRNRLASNMKNFKNTLAEQFHTEPPVILTSSVETTGKEEILDAIEQSGLSFP